MEFVLSLQDVFANEAEQCKAGTSWKDLLVLAWPGVLNMLSIIVQGMGLQYISASVSQMISGLSRFFSNLFAPAHASSS